MSAAPKSIEGSWEEIQRHAAEFAGHRLKIIVLDESPAPLPQPHQNILSPQEWVAWLHDWAYNRPPINFIVDDSRDAIYEDFLK